MWTIYLNVHIEHPWRRTPPSHRRGTRQSCGRGRSTWAGSACWRAPPPARWASTTERSPRFHPPPPPRSQKPWRWQWARERGSYSDPRFSTLLLRGRRSMLNSGLASTVPRSAASPAGLQRQQQAAQSAASIRDTDTAPFQYKIIIRKTKKNTQATNNNNNNSHNNNNNYIITSYYVIAWITYIIM